MKVFSREKMSIVKELESCYDLSKADDRRET